MAAAYQHSYRSDSERIRMCVDVQRNGCWRWRLTTFRSGYGMIRVRGKNMLAHRFAWEALRGPIPEGAALCHRCNVKLCCNPHHLYIGTTQTNADDVARARSLLGSKHPRARFDEGQVRAIRAEYARGGVIYAELAKRYGVSLGTIGAIINGRNWRHVQVLQPPRPSRVIGEQAPRAKLTDVAVRNIRTAFARGARQVDLARQYKVAPPTIGAVIRWKSWKHVK